ncbi:MAG: DUF4179 domain-containing protein [Coriobacteriales bacterium]|jgi:hypothetical protein|nr:DUF4179 domain-containing protein [Coriobacteriales bacterium]
MNEQHDNIMDDTPLEDLLALEPQEVDTEKIARLTLQKIALGDGMHNQRRRAATMQHEPRRRSAATAQRKPRRVAFYALAAVLATLFVGGTAFAIGSLLAGPNPIEFEDVTVKGQPLADREKFNVAVGQTVELDGVSVTCDTVAVDGNFVDVYLTYTYDDPIDLSAELGIELSENDYAFHMFTPQPTVSVNGYSIGQAGREAKDGNTYFADDEHKVIKTVTDYLIPITVSDVVEIEVTIDPLTSNDGSTSALPEQVVFKTQVDISGAATETVAVAPGQYEFVIDGQTRILDLEKLAITPFGVVISVHTHDDALSAGGTYLDLRDFRIIDDQGNEYGKSVPDPNPPLGSHNAHYMPYSLFTPGSALQGELHAGELRGGPAGIKSFTIVPISKVNESGPRTYGLTDIGVQIPVTPTGGYYLRSYQVSGNILTITAEPYGDEIVSHSSEFILDDDSLDEQALDGLMTTSYDKETNLYTTQLEFYTASEEEIREITHFHVYYYEGEPLFAGDISLTLPLL